MSNNNSKQVTVTLPKGVAERLSYLRKVVKSPSELQRVIATVVESSVALHEQKMRIGIDDWTQSKTCPKCNSGTLMVRRPKGDPGRPFLGCSKFPDCRHKEDIVSAKQKQ